MSRRNLQNRLKATIYAFALLCLTGKGFTQPAAPTLNPTPEAFTTPYEVQIKCPDRNTQVYWTEDGTTPTKSSSNALRSTNVSLTKTTTLKAFCQNLIVFNSSLISGLTEGTYTQKAAAIPAVKPGTGYYSTPLTVTLDVSSGNTNIYYTLDGSIPTTKSQNINPGGNIQITPPATLKAIGVRNGYANSDVLTAIYNKKETVATPTANPGATTFSEPLSVTLTTSTNGATLFYTTDNSSPITNGKIYDGRAISLTQSMASANVVNLRAYATKDNMDPSSEIKVAYTFKPRAATPQASFTDPNFTDSLVLNFSSPTPGAIIRITRDGKDPTETSEQVANGQSIKLYNSQTISAITYAAGFKESFVFRQQYNLKLSAPIITPSDKLNVIEFKDLIPVRLYAANPNAVILYTLNGNDPDLGSTKVSRNTTINISSSDTTKLKAFAYFQAENIKSAIALARYLKSSKPSMAAPQATPPGGEFLDSQEVFIHLPRPEARVFYTLDGSTPDTVKGTLLLDTATPLVLKATTVLHLRAYAPDALPSGVAEEIYTQIPQSPFATPDPFNGPYPTDQKVTLSTVTPGADILFMAFDDETGVFDPNEAQTYTTPLTLAKNTVIRAQTALGIGSKRVLSKTILTANYKIEMGANDSLLASGDSAKLNGYAIKTNAGVIRFTSERADSLVPDNWIKPPFAIRIRSNGDLPFQVTLKPGDSTQQVLYLVEKGQPPRYVSGFQVITPGLYLFAQDLNVPKVSLLSSTPALDGKTQVRLSISDDIQNATYRIRASHDGVWNTEQTLSSPADTVSFAFQNTKSQPALWFQIQVSDHIRTIFFPPDSSHVFQLQQGFNEIETPSIFALGKEVYRYDLIGLPSSPPSLTTQYYTLGRLKSDNPSAQFRGVVFNTDIGSSELSDSIPLSAGMGFWLASSIPLNALKLKRFTSVSSDEEGEYKIKLRPKWNMISNPSLQTLWWPIQRKQFGYSTQLVRGLVGWNSTTLNYQTADSLEPWKGYFVYNAGKSDTSITLNPSKPIALAKLARSNSQFAWISLQPQQGLPLVLAASPQSTDAVDAEDEPELMTPAIVSPTPNIFRAGVALQSDFIRLRENQLMTWTVATGKTLNEKNEMELRVDNLNLPTGYSAWAIWPKRHLKQKLSEGLRLQNVSLDTLMVLVGKETLMANSDLLAASLDSQTLQNQIQYLKSTHEIRISLKQNARVTLKRIDASGKLTASFFDSNLGQGLHSELLSKATASVGKAWIRIEVVPLDGSPRWHQNLCF